MILKNRVIDNPQNPVGGQSAEPCGWAIISLRVAYCLLLIVIFSFATCKYGFKDVSIPVEVKTFRVTMFENKAQYVNPQLSPQLTEKLKQKIISTTRLRQTNSEDVHYDIGGFVSEYYVSTTGISNNDASQNRLTVSVHLSFKNKLVPDGTKDIETNVSGNFLLLGLISATSPNFLLSHSGNSFPSSSLKRNVCEKSCCITPFL